MENNLEKNRVDGFGKKNIKNKSDEEEIQYTCRADQVEGAKTYQI